MKTLAALMAAMVVLALFTREFNWKARALLLGAIIAMLVMLSR